MIEIYFFHIKNQYNEYALYQRSFGLFKRLSKQTPDRALHMLASYVFDFDK